MENTGGREMKGHKRFFGSPLTGFWSVEGTDMIVFPKQLRDKETEFAWGLNSKTGLMFPYLKNGEPLVYEEI